jgi:hypothetical protein
VGVVGDGDGDELFYGHNRVSITHHAAEAIRAPPGIGHH